MLSDYLLALDSHRSDQTSLMKNALLTRVLTTLKLVGPMMRAC